jgi:hypothetical protein
MGNIDELLIYGFSRQKKTQKSGSTIGAAAPSTRTAWVLRDDARWGVSKFTLYGETLEWDFPLTKTSPSERRR